MLKPKFNSKKIKAELQKRVERINQAILTRLQLIGETFVANARLKAADIYFVEINGNKVAKHKPGPRSKVIGENTPGFIDHTSNLRSSIGYMVLFNGKPFAGSDFSTIPGGSEGTLKGKNFIKEISTKYKNDGFVLIGVAGMNYAAAVESKGYDVITGSSRIVERELKEAWKKITKKIR